MIYPVWSWAGWVVSLETVSGAGAGWEWRLFSLGTETVVDLRLFMFRLFNLELILVRSVGFFPFHSQSWAWNKMGMI
jgi:hypothetical protein